MLRARSDVTPGCGNRDGKDRERPAPISPALAALAGSCDGSSELLKSEASLQVLISRLGSQAVKIRFCFQRDDRGAAALIAVLKKRKRLFLLVIPIGVNSERGLIAAACDRCDFPDQIDQQMLSVAANNAATAFQNARLINELRTAQKALCDQEQELRKAHDGLEIKVAERTSELRRSERELRDVIDTIPAIVWSTLPDGSNTYANKRFVEYTGLSAEQVAGSGWQSLPP